MPRFKFRLEALLTHRQQLEKEQQRRVAQVQQEIQAVVRGIQETQARISFAFRQILNLPPDCRSILSRMAAMAKVAGNAFSAAIIRGSATS